MTDKQHALLGLTRTVLGTSVWIAVCVAGAAALENIELLQKYDSLAKVVVGALGLLGGCGALWGHWRITRAYSYYRDGYRVRWLSERTYAYEEFDTDGMLRFLNFSYEPLAQAYAPPCRMAVPTVEMWDSQTPAWAHGRREEILSRLAKWARGGYEQPVTFVPPTDVQGPS